VKLAVALALAGAGIAWGVWLARRSRRPGACQCGHPREVHQHDRRGSDCALCWCESYRRA